MTAKEKAKELFEKLWSEALSDIQAKECALIAVDEIKEALKITTGHLTINRLLERQELQDDFNYWKEVKQEIKKLCLNNYF